MAHFNDRRRAQDGHRRQRPSLCARQPRRGRCGDCLLGQQAALQLLASGHGHSGRRERRQRGDQSADAAWEPLINTPNYPDYTSGANNVTAAMTTILERVFGPGEFSFSVTLGGAAREAEVAHLQALLRRGGRGGRGAHPARHSFPVCRHGRAHARHAESRTGRSSTCSSQPSLRAENSGTVSGSTAAREASGDPRAHGARVTRSAAGLAARPGHRNFGFATELRQHRVRPGIRKKPAGQT